jgi:hypothetical protein
MRLPWLAVALLLACSLEASAQTYTIKLKSHPDAGKTVTVQVTDKETTSTKTIDAKGKAQEEVAANSSETVYALTVLARKKGAEPPEKYTRAYVKATETDGGKTRAFSYQGRTVVFEKKDGKYRVGVVGKQPLDEEDLERLIEKANDGPDKEVVFDRAITPDRAVAVGDRWPVDPVALTSRMGLVLDRKASRADAKLVKAYRKGKSQFGVIQVEVKLAVKEVAREARFDPPAVMEVKMTIDTAIDGSSTARTEIVSARFKGKGRPLAGKDEIEFDRADSSRSVSSEEKDDPKAREVPVVKLVGPEGDWSELTSKEGRFSVSFPGKPVMARQEGKDEVSTTWEVRRDRGAVGYSVTYTDFTNPDKGDPKKLIAAAADAFAREAKKKAKKRSIELNGFPGVEVELEHMGVDAVSRMYLVKDRFYNVIVVGPRGSLEKLQARRFLDSFKLHDRKDAKGSGKKGKE